MTIITVMQTEIKMSAEESTALKKSVTEISANFQDIVTRVNETGKSVSGKCGNHHTILQDRGESQDFPEWGCQPMIWPKTACK